jgi:hypothetical protein
MNIERVQPAFSSATNADENREREKKKISKENFNFFFMTVILLTLGNTNIYYEPVLWMRDILVRIRIRGSVPLTYGSQNSRNQRFFLLLLYDGRIRIRTQIRGFVTPSR